MGRLIARTPRRWESRPSSSSAGGHELQPWLVKSSTTTGRAEPACADPVASNAIEAMDATKIRVIIARTYERVVRAASHLRLNRARQTNQNAECRAFTQQPPLEGTPAACGTHRRCLRPAHAVVVGPSSPGKLRATRRDLSRSA